MHGIVDHIDPDLIHIHAPNQFSTAALILGKIKKIPVVATVHRAEVDSTNFLLSLARRMILSKYRHVVAVSEYSMKLASNSGVKASNIQVIYNSCNETIFQLQSKLDARKLRNLPHKENIILFVGNIIEIKGIYVLIDTLNILKNRLDFHAVVIGKGKEEDLIKKYAAKLKILNKISFIGSLAQQELSSYYNAADVFFLPSYVEGNSVAILEAMYLGLPIVASNTGGNPEIISHGVNGYLVTVGNALEFAQRIEQILTQRGLQFSLSKNCKEIYNKKFSNKKQIDQYLRLYNDVLEMKLNK
jgi:glycosyltransferase involved in cell wall biosynthesis